MAKTRRKPPSAALQRKFRVNRIKRRFIDARMEEIDSELLALEGRSGRKALDKALELAEEKARLGITRTRLPVRRRPRGGRSSGNSSTGLRLFG